MSGTAPAGRQRGTWGRAARSGHGYVVRWLLTLALIVGAGTAGTMVSLAGAQGSSAVDRESSRFASDAEMASWTMLGVTSGVMLNGEPMMTVVGLDRTWSLDLPLLAGALPRGPHEVAIGPAVASARGLWVGDTVEVGGVISPPRRARVTAIMVFPTLEPSGAGWVGSGAGLLLPEAALDGTRLGVAVRSLVSFIDLTALARPAHRLRTE
jgi:hypothetical protein